MSDDRTSPETSTNLSDSPPTGELPPDFFNTPEAVEVDSQTTNGATLEDRLPPRLATRPTRPRLDRARPSILPIVGAVLLGNVVLFVGGGLAGWALSRKYDVPRTSVPTPTSPPVVPPGGPPAESKATQDERARFETHLAAIHTEIKNLTVQFVTLAKDMGRLHAQLESMPKPPAPPDLKPLQSRVDRLVDEVERLAARPSELHGLSERFAVLDKRLDELRTEVAKLPSQWKEGHAPASKPADSRERAESAKPTTPWASGVDLFRQGQYAQAREEFIRQSQSVPEDARFWYYAALANGLATGDWGGETSRLVQRGLERERAGTPRRAEVDELLNGLKADQGRDWLKEWRARSIPR